MELESVYCNIEEKPNVTENKYITVQLERMLHKQRKCCLIEHLNTFFELSCFITALVILIIVTASMIVNTRRTSELEENQQLLIDLVRDIAKRSSAAMTKSPTELST